LAYIKTGDPVGGDPEAPPQRKIEGHYLKRINKSIRHFKYNASEFNKTANTEHRLKVPAGKMWEFMGGYLTRGVCTATAVVNVCTSDATLRRRLLVLASGASDTTDIPDNVARIRENEILYEQQIIRILFGGAQNSDSLFNIDILESETK